MDDITGWLRLAGLALYFGGIFFVVRWLATGRMDDFLRKVLLYGLAFGGTFLLVALNRVLPDAVLIALFLALIPAIFAILTAPDKR
jgi:hypothetical protein